MNILAPLLLILLIAQPSWGAEVRGSGGGGIGAETQSLNDVCTVDCEITTAVSEATGHKVGDGTNKVSQYWDPTDGYVVKPNPLGDAAWRCWTNFNCIVRDEEAGKNFLVIDPDALGAGSGTLTLQTSEQLVTSNLGVEFTESDTNPSCATGNYNIYADTSEAKLKKCQNGTATDLDTTSAGGDTFVLKTSDEVVNNSNTLQNDDALVFAMDASSWYVVRGIITYQAGSTADFQIDIDVPSGATGRRVYEYPPSSANSCLMTAYTAYGGSISTTAGPIGGIGTAVSCEIKIDAIVQTGTTPGNFQVTWSQSTAVSENATVKAGSYLRYRKVQ